jgi:hypothetical protein
MVEMRDGPGAVDESSPDRMRPRAAQLSGAWRDLAHDSRRCLRVSVGGVTERRIRGERMCARSTNSAKPLSES